VWVASEAILANFARRDAVRGVRQAQRLPKPSMTHDHPGVNDVPFDTDDDRWNVLYVEDHPVNVLLMEALFSKRPRARLNVAMTGEAGMQAAREQAPDLLLLDLRLPDCHGSDLLQRLRALPGLAEVPAVAVTAEDTRDLGTAGFVEIWHKPMDMHATLFRLDRLLARCSHDRDVADPAQGTSIGQARIPLPLPIPFPSATPG
jgi:CheY-like chemotaxis protein